MTRKENRWSIWRQFDRSFMVPLFGGAEDPDDPKNDPELMEELIQRIDKAHQVSSLS